LASLDETNNPTQWYYQHHEEGNKEGDNYQGELSVLWKGSPVKVAVLVGPVWTARR